MLRVSTTMEDGTALQQVMIDLPYSLIIEATEEPDYFGFYSDTLEGFSGIGHSIEDCLYQARWGMIEHVKLLKEMGMPVPQPPEHPRVVILNEIKSQDVTPPEFAPA